MSRRDPHAIKSMPPEALVEEFRPLVGSIVNKLRRQLSLRIAIEDLEAYGFEGLLDAQLRFDPDDGSYFASYAYYRIRGNILDGCRREGWIGRSRAHRRMRAMDEMLESHGEDERNAPRPQSLAEAIDRVAGVVDAAAVIHLLADSDLDQVAPVEPTQHERIEQAENEAMLAKALKCLSEEELEVIQRFHFDQEPMDEIAALFGRSRSWVSRVNTRALKKMKQYLLSSA